MTKNIPTSMHEVTDQWLIDILSSHQAFADAPISSVDRQSVGDGIGQVGDQQGCGNDRIGQANHFIFKTAGAH